MRNKVLRMNYVRCAQCMGIRSRSDINEETNICCICRRKNEKFQFIPIKTLGGYNNGIYANKKE